MKVVCVCLALCVLTGCASRDMDLAGSTMLGLAPEAAPPVGAEAIMVQMMDGPSVRDLDRRDKALLSAAIATALQTPSAGTAQTWKNSLSGHSGSVTPGPVYTVNDLACRDYVQLLSVSGHQETIRSTACQQSDGTWRSLS